MSSTLLNSATLTRILLWLSIVALAAPLSRADQALIYSTDFSTAREMIASMSVRSATIMADT